MSELKWWERVYASLTTPDWTSHLNSNVFEWMNANAKFKKVLNLGSGIGKFDKLLSSEISMVNVDIDGSKPGLAAVADAHKLPFADESFDIVYSIAVLEHVRKPWVVAREIHRVLRPSGHVVLELPFLNVIHDYHDYFRFTDRGIRSLFDAPEFTPVLEQVGSGGGSFLSVFMSLYFRQFIPGKLPQRVWYALTAYPFSLLRYLDCVSFDKSIQRKTANSFSYIGMKTS